MSDTKETYTRGRGGRGRRPYGGRNFYNRSSKLPETEDSNSQLDVEPSNQVPQHKTTNNRKGAEITPKPSYLNLPATRPPKDKSQLSTTATPLKNDPMWLDSFVKSTESGFTPDGGIKTFAPSCDSFAPLVDKTYTEMAAVDTQLGRQIPRSAFNYYMTMHFWARIVAIRQTRGLADYPETQFHDYVQSVNYLVPTPIAAYLKSLGTFTTAEGNEYQFRVPAMPESFGANPGTFGRVSANTHYLYENYPAPWIALKRVERDFHRTLNQQEPGVWDLPTALTPAERDEGHPTVNLLGWYPAAILSQQQKAFISACLDDGDLRIDKFEQFSMNSSLFEAVGAYINTALRNYSSVPGVFSSESGSHAQTAVLERQPPDNYVFNRTAYYCEGAVRGASSQRLDRPFALATQIFGYRTRRDRWIDNTIDAWCCYDFTDYTAVPDEWQETRNQVYEFGEVAKINVLDHHTPYTDKDRLRVDLLRNYVTRKE